MPVYKNSIVADRRQRIIDLLLTGNAVSSKRLMELENVTKRMIERDIFELRQAGYDIQGFKGTGGGFVLFRKAR